VFSHARPNPSTKVEDEVSPLMYIHIFMYCSYIFDIKIKFNILLSFQLYDLICIHCDSLIKQIHWMILFKLDICCDLCNGWIH
jgi:hypothetical protein